MATTGKPPPCSFFARGFCRAGADCRFSHDLEVAVAGELPVPPSGPSPGAALCRFYQAGNCRAGDGCRFRHQRATAGPGAPVASPAGDGPVVIPEVRGPLVSIDVECVATGHGHHDRSIAQVALVNSECETVLNVFVKPEKPIVSFLTPLTGLSAEQLDAHGVSLEEALQALRQALPAEATMVGMNILKDVEWLGLSEGTDYSTLIDLAGLFRVRSPEGRLVYFSQDHAARVWLRGTPFERCDGHAHDAAADAATSMALFHAYMLAARSPEQLARLQAETLNAPRAPSFAMRYPSFEGVCQGNRKSCTCGQPFYA